MNGRGGRPWRRLRAQILATNDTCWLCGNRGADTLDHVLELAKGGTNHPSNLRPAHGQKIDGVCPGNYGRSANVTRQHHTRAW